MAYRVVAAPAAPNYCINTNIQAAAFSPPMPFLFKWKINLWHFIWDTQIIMTGNRERKKVASGDYNTAQPLLYTMGKIVTISSRVR